MSDEVKTPEKDDKSWKLSPEELKERREAQVAEITEKLEAGVKSIFSGEAYKSFLETMAKMPHYSVNNQVLIMMQTGGQATMCNSFTGWKEMGRHVKEGEKGIKIFAHAPYKLQKEVEKLDDNGKPVLDANGEPVKEMQEVTMKAFKVVSTFDISQTEGKELPTLGATELMGRVDAYPIIIEAVKGTCPVPISYEQIDGGAKGYYDQANKNIVIQEGMSEVQTLKTLIHEMAHQRLHDKDSGFEAKPRAQKEVEAESVAFVVCDHFGIDTADYSFGYVAGWSEGKEMPELKASLETIRGAAVELIGKIEDKIKEMAQEQGEVVMDSVVDRLKELTKEVVKKLDGKIKVPKKEQGAI